MDRLMPLWPARLLRLAGARRKFYERLLPNIARRRRFVTHYRQNYWRGEESRSGRGSGMEQTALLRVELPGLLRSIGARSILDVPCGDFHWMQFVDLAGITYTGADIVPAMIAENRRRYHSPTRSFVTLDVVAQAPPHADVVLCRDLLVHLPYRDIAKALANLRRSGATWLLTTTFTARTANTDLLGSDWRPLNFIVPPFNFPAPHALIVEGCTEDAGRYADKSLGLWRLADLR